MRSTLVCMLAALDCLTRTRYRLTTRIGCVCGRGRVCGRALTFFIVVTLAAERSERVRVRNYERRRRRLHLCRTRNSRHKHGLQCARH